MARLGEGFAGWGQDRAGWGQDRAGWGQDRAGWGQDRADEVTCRMPTTGGGLGWPPQESASGGNWSGNWPDVGVGWPARPSIAGRTAFPSAITEVPPFGGISATAGQAAPAWPVRGYARPVVGGTGNAASSAAERTRSAAPALAGGKWSEGGDPVTVAAAAAGTSIVAC